MDSSQYFQVGSKLFSLPSWTNPECIFNASSRKEILVQTRKYKGSRFLGKTYKNSLRLKKALLSNDYIIGKGNLSIFNEVQDYLSQEIVFVFLLRSRDRGYIKNTIAYMDSKYRVLAYLKHSNNSDAIKIIKNEKRILRRIAEGLGPQFLSEINSTSGYGILISPIIGQKVSINCKSELLQTYLSRLPRREAVNTEDHPWINSVLRTNGSVAEKLVESISDVKWDIVLQHGDFAPWNLLLQNEEKLIAYDWEYARFDGFPLYDIVYYHLQIECLIKRGNPLSAYNHIVRSLAGNVVRVTHLESLIKLVCLDMNHRSGIEGGINSFADDWRQKILRCNLCD